MLDVWRVKKTKQIVYPIGTIDGKHTLCLFPFKTVSKNGKNGVVQPVRNDNLVKDRETL
jgi:hypothetical protein